MPLSTIESIPRELLEHIVLYTILAHGQLGPPVPLVPLLTLSRNIHSKLSNNEALLRTIFAFKFDINPPIRRFGVKYVTSSAIANELRSRCRLIKRFRNAENVAAATLEDDFWKASLMFMESDGRNELQLIEYSYLSQFMDRWWSERLIVDFEDGYPIDNTQNSLGVYLLWRTKHQRSIREAVFANDYSLPNALKPFSLACFKYANAFVPEVHYHLPISRLATMPPSTFPFAHTSYPVYRPFVTYSAEDIANPRPGSALHAVSHFGMTLHLSPPLLTQAALLLFFAHYEVRGIVPTDSTPATRAERDAIGMQQPSREDLEEHNQYACTRFIPRLTLEDADDQGSTRFDEDFQRMLWCGNPFDHPSSGRTYRLGSLTGLWEGRMLFPDTEGYASLLADPHLPDHFEDLFFITSPFKVRLKEWYCPTDESPLDWGRSEPSEGLLNAWLPRSATLETRGHQLEVQANNGEPYQYHEWRNDIPLSHDEHDCSFCETVSDAGTDPDAPYRFENSFVPSGDDCPEHLDVLVTGETDSVHAKAWGDYRFYGRVRPYDGLIVLVREWARPEQNGHGRWIFRGYVTADQNFVGRWRDGATSPGGPGIIEGSFTLNKRVE